MLNAFQPPNAGCRLLSWVDRDACWVDALRRVDARNCPLSNYHIKHKMQDQQQHPVTRLLVISNIYLMQTPPIPDIVASIQSHCVYLRDITISTYLLNIYVSTQYLVSTQDAESAAVQCYRNTRSPGGGVRAESGEIMRTAGLLGNHEVITLCSAHCAWAHWS